MSVLTELYEFGRVQSPAHTSSRLIEQFRNKGSRITSAPHWLLTTGY